MHCDSLVFFLQNILTECGKQQCSAAWRWQCWDGRWAKWSSPPPSECRRTETDPGEECFLMLLNIVHKVR